MPRPFALAGTPVRYLADRPVSVEHVRLELDLDLPGRRVTGRSRLTLRVRRDELPAVELHAVDMTIDEVKVDGSPPRSYRYDGRTLRIELPHPYERDSGLELEVAYRCAPRRGLFFVGPDDSDPARLWQCWTQGQDEDSRHYWPGLDIPAEKATSEVICIAPRDLFVLSNGDLRERVEVGTDRARWHYALGFPHAGYLITLVCGAFTETKDRAPETGVEVFYYVPPGREADARRSYGATPAMVDFFSKRIGLPYPHRRYSQIAVSDFIFGGMENTTATTLTVESLLDERASLDHDVEGLVAHELAHQWWGNLLTCREWAEAWLNEGFATYFEYVWREHAHGRDEADAELLNDTQAYLGEAGKYQRPIVCRQYDEPIELFDSHLYDKGGRVLHMLRHTLGDEVFWRALNLYAQRHAHRSVETRDLARAVEEASGRNLDPFFDQWIGTPGHPELKGTWRWDDEPQVGRLHLEQKQSHDRVYSFDVKIVFEIDGVFSEQTLQVRERNHDFELPLEGRPEQVIFDPGDVVLKTIELEKPRPLWIRQLHGAPLAVDRIMAARALGELPGPDTVAALREALKDDPFWASRAAAARSLGQIRGGEAREALVAFRSDSHPKVRRAVAAALGELRDDPEAGAVLARWAADGDPSYFVEAAAAMSLGKGRGQEALSVLPALLGRDSFQDVIRSRALEGLGATGDERALPILEAAYVSRARFQSRRAAVTAVARLTEGTANARRGRELLERALDDRDFRVRMDAASGLATLQDSRAIAALERAARAEMDGRARRRLRDTITDLTEKGRPIEQARKVTEELERLRKELGDMRGRLEKLEQRPPDGSPTNEPAGRKRVEVLPGRRPRPKVRRGIKPPRRRGRS